MLIHHFGSKEGLWIEIVHTVEARQREMLGELLPDPDQPIRRGDVDVVEHISDPSLWPNERLFFELYGQALQGREHTAQFLDGIVEDWLGPAAEINVGPRSSPRTGPGPRPARRGGHARPAARPASHRRRGRRRRRDGRVHRRLRGVGRARGAAGRPKVRPSNRNRLTRAAARERSALVDPTRTFHRSSRPRMTVMRRPRSLAQRCCLGGGPLGIQPRQRPGRTRVVLLASASLPDGPRTSPSPAKRSGGAH